MADDEIVEIPRSRLATLERVTNLANTLWNDEKVGLTVKERVKELDPSANIPEVVVAQNARKVEQEIISRVEAREKAVDERIAAFEAKQKERDEKDQSARDEREFATDVDSVKRKYQLTDAGMEKVFARMREKNNPDLESAAAWVTDHEPKAAPVTGSPYAPQEFSLYGSGREDKEWEELNKNPMRYGDRVLAEMASDFANGNYSKYREFGGNL